MLKNEMSLNCWIDTVSYVIAIFLVNERNDYSAFSDNVIKELLVVPEGFPVERVHSHMACPKGRTFQAENQRRIVNM
jgi:hypothetical protein